MNKYLLAIILLAGSNAFAGVNKWVDSENRVHYSDQPPPPDAKSAVREKSKTRPPVTDSSDTVDKSGQVTIVEPGAQKTYAEREADLKKAAKEKQAAADKAAQKKAQEDALKANCTAAKNNLKALQDGMRIVEFDANGERVFIDDKQREERTAEAQKAVSEYCK